MKMKIGLPTDDKLSITGCFTRSKYFRITEVDKLKIIREEYRENIWPNKDEKNINEELQQKVYEILSDCDVFMTDSLCPEFELFLKRYNKEIVLLKEKNITMAVYDYILEVYQKECNTCCCP